MYKYSFWLLVCWLKQQASNSYTPLQLQITHLFVNQLWNSQRKRVIIAPGETAAANKQPSASYFRAAQSAACVYTVAQCWLLACSDFNPCCAFRLFHSAYTAQCKSTRWVARWKFLFLVNFASIPSESESIELRSISHLIKYIIAINGSTLKNYQNSGFAYSVFYCK